MKYTTDRNDAQMTLAVVASEHNVPYTTVNTTSELMDYFDIPPDIYVTSVLGENIAIDLLWEFETNKFLQFHIQEHSISIIDGMRISELPEHQYKKSIQDCIDIYKEYSDEIRKEFAIYEKSF